MADEKFFFVCYRKKDQKRAEAELPKEVQVGHQGKTYVIAFGKASRIPFPKRVAVTLAGKHKNWTNGVILTTEAADARDIDESANSDADAKAKAEAEAKAKADADAKAKANQK